MRTATCNGQAAMARSLARSGLGGSAENGQREVPKTPRRLSRAKWRPVS